MFQIFIGIFKYIKVYKQNFAIMSEDERKYAAFVPYFEKLVERHAGDIGKVKLAELLGTKQPIISKIYGGYSLPSPDIIRKIEEVWGEDISEVVAEVKKERNKKIRSMSMPVNDDDLLPHIPSTSAAGGIGGFSDTVTQNTCEFRPVIKMIPKYDMTIDVKGDSMLPKYQNGDIVAIRRVVDVIEWGCVYVLDTADGAVLKRLYDEEECFRCVSYNPEYHDFLVNKQNVYGVYKVVGLIRI